MGDNSISSHNSEILPKRLQHERALMAQSLIVSLLQSLQLSRTCSAHPKCWLIPYAPSTICTKVVRLNHLPWLNQPNDSIWMTQRKRIDIFYSMEKSQPEPALNSKILEVVLVIRTHMKSLGAFVNDRIQRNTIRGRFTMSKLLSSLRSQI